MLIVKYFPSVKQMSEGPSSSNIKILLLSRTLNWLLLILKASTSEI